VANAPQIDDVLEKFLEIIEGSLIVGHRANFPMRFLYDNADGLDLGIVSNDFIDTMRLAHHLYPDAPGYSLQNIVNWLELGGKQENRALPDARMAYNLYDYMRKDAASRGAELVGHASRYERPEGVKRPKSDLLVFDLWENPVPNPLFIRKTFVFTGTLMKIERSSVKNVVTNLGGRISGSVSKKTNYLVVGNDEWNAPEIRRSVGWKSDKLKTVIQLNQEGNAIEIVSEDTF
jgi:DNA polymerase-3 subunit epsilon